MNTFSKIAVLSVLPFISSVASAADAPNLAERAAAEYLNLAKYPEWTLPVRPIRFCPSASPMW